MIPNEYWLKCPSWSVFWLLWIRAWYLKNVLGTLREQHDGPDNWCRGVVNFIVGTVQAGRGRRFQFLYDDWPLLRVHLSRAGTQWRRWSILLNAGPFDRFRIGAIRQAGRYGEPFPLLQNGVKWEIVTELGRARNSLNDFLLRPTNDCPPRTDVVAVLIAIPACASLDPACRDRRNRSW